VQPVIPVTQGSTNRRIVVQASLGIQGDPILKITNTKKAGREVQLAGYLPSKHEGLSSTSSTTKTNQQKQLLVKMQRN
jgi:hypothetical protein